MCFPGNIPNNNNAIIAMRVQSPTNQPHQSSTYEMVVDQILDQLQSTQTRLIKTTHVFKIEMLPKERELKFSFVFLQCLFALEISFEITALLVCIFGAYICIFTS